MSTKIAAKTPRRQKNPLSWRLGVLAASLSVACSGTPTKTPGPPAWHVVLANQPPTLLSVWGAAADDVLAVGGPLGNGSPSAVLHYDGNAWTDLRPGGTETFWWAHGTSRTDAWIVGEKGRILHWDGQTVTEGASRPTSATLFGVWAAAPDDAWAVGGTPGGGSSAPNDVVLHYDGTSWTASPPPQALGRAFFKVWGSARDDLYVVGEAGTVWHRKGAVWALESSPPIATGTLLTVNGCGPGEVYAVGGRDVLRSDGRTWTRVDVQLDNDVNGVSCAAPGQVVLVGSAGLKERLVAGQWQDDFALEPHTDLHGAWADPTGAYWAAGGDFSSGPRAGASRGGTLVYYGVVAPSGTTR